ncbi:DUF5004 domain-containing protein [Christiangramia crocea]|uniref:DUF5004 domain-containing protein n=1 Tax=Christiangramia crocea TaxID=2904124 RepID=A0A9X1UXY0_9FLAO|nr:DUF5004 domain-containing protein [Gramella crocea]MCG9971584.1 DUF5004 domain-containing protein [Gramella crocea]
MMNVLEIKKLAFFSLVALLLMSCSKEEAYMEDEMIKVSNATITSNDLIGHWKLSRMVSDTAVNLNQDGSYSTNLMDETSCFNNMSITFNSDGTFITNNATMTFESGSNGDQFSCIADRIDTGDWKVENDNLVLTMDIDGFTYTHSKAIDMTSNTFSFDVTKIESDQYVDDPGNTQASEIRILELEYTKAE